MVGSKPSSYIIIDNTCSSCGSSLSDISTVVFHNALLSASKNYVTRYKLVDAYLEPRYTCTFKCIPGNHPDLSGHGNSQLHSMLYDRARPELI